MSKLAKSFLKLLIGAIVGSLLTYSLDYYVFPFWERILAISLGKPYVYKAEPGITVERFANDMTKRMGSRYIITFTPKAAQVQIGPGKYKARKDWRNLVLYVLERNAGNLRYVVDDHKRYIHICLSTETCKKE
ncbi:MAG: hypothetical protein DRG40_03540 [Deltaproteobacteria bacterium]|nr:MAG: hypothetical protein DRG40_03540 [Deltaproteobacteria bacterium]